MYNLNANKRKLQTIDSVKAENEAIAKPIVDDNKMLQDLERDIIFMRNYELDRSCSNGTIKTRERYVRIIHRHFGCIEYTQDFVNRVREEAATKGLGKGKRCTNGTIRLYLYALEDLFNSVGHKITIGKPKVVRPLYDNPEKYHTPEEIQKILSPINVKRDRAILYLLYFAALRNCELCNLYPEDIDLNKRLIRVRDHGDGLKTYQERVIPVPVECYMPLKAWIDERATWDDCPDPHMFVSTRDKRMTTNRIRQMVRNYAANVGLKTWPHKLRHSRCSFLANDAKMPLPQLKKFMGHSSIMVTMQYIHSSTEQMKGFIDSIPEIKV